MSAILYKNSGPVEFEAQADVQSGEIVSVGDLTGVVVRDAKAGETAQLDIHGTYRIPSSVTDVGTPVTLDPGDQDAVAAANDGRYDGLVVGVYETGVAKVSLERGLVESA